MIENLLYLITSHPNISFSVGACTRYQANPKELQLIYVKRIIRYINETFDYGLCYPYDYSFVIIGYSDADWAKNVKDKKNTSGVFILFFW